MKRVIILLAFFVVIFVQMIQGVFSYETYMGIAPNSLTYKAGHEACVKNTTSGLYGSNPNLYRTCAKIQKQVGGVWSDDSTLNCSSDLRLLPIPSSPMPAYRAVCTTSPVLVQVSVNVTNFSNTQVLSGAQVTHYLRNTDIVIVTRTTAGTWTPFFQIDKNWGLQNGGFMTLGATFSGGYWAREDTWTDVYTATTRRTISVDKCVNTDNPLNPGGVNNDIYVAGKASHKFASIIDQCNTQNPNVIEEAFCGSEGLPTSTTFACAQGYSCQRDTRTGEDYCAPDLPPCIDQCSDGEARCAGSALEVCQVNGGTGCREWSSTTCPNGCVDNSGNTDICQSTPGCPPNWTPCTGTQSCSGQTTGTQSDGCGGTQTCTLPQITCLSGQTCNSQGQCVSSGGTCTDGDGDEYYLGSGCTTEPLDCPNADDNSAINPGATERCGDQIDENCNGDLEDGCNTELCGSFFGTEEIYEYLSGTLQTTIVKCEDYTTAVKTTTGFEGLTSEKRDVCNADCAKVASGSVPDYLLGALRSVSCTWNSTACKTQYDTYNGQTCKIDYLNGDEVECVPGQLTRTVMVNATTLVPGQNGELCNAGCGPGIACEKEIPCPRTIELPFYGWSGFLMSILGIVLIYFLFGIRRKI